MTAFIIKDNKESLAVVELSLGLDKYGNIGLYAETGTTKIKIALIQEREVGARMFLATNIEAALEALGFECINRRLAVTQEAGNHESF